MSTPINEPVVVDASAIVTLADAALPEHDRCLQVSRSLPIGKTYVCWPVVTEASYLLRKSRQSRRELLAAIDNAEFEILDLTRDDIDGMQAVLDKYHDQQVDLADAAMVHLANREGIRTVFTLNRRHFRLFTRGDGSPFRLLPDDFEAGE